jgi:hypothetical protein
MKIVHREHLYPSWVVVPHTFASPASFSSSADILLWFRNLTTDAVIDFLRMRRKQSSKN